MVVFPTEWKLARVVPVPKGDNPRNLVSGYRPISILPTVSKILEHHANETLLDHISETCPITDHQWGFMHHRSSICVHISVFHDCLEAG